MKVQGSTDKNRAIDVSKWNKDILVFYELCENKEHKKYLKQVNYKLLESVTIVWVTHLMSNNWKNLLLSECFE